MGVPEVLQSLFQAGRCLRYPGVAVDGTVEGFPVIADFVGVVGDITRIGQLRTHGRKQKTEVIFCTGFCQQCRVCQWCHTIVRGGNPRSTHRIIAGFKI